MSDVVIGVAPVLPRGRPWPSWAHAAPARATSASPAPWPSVAVQRDLRRARSEWLHTNGAGAYASSTVAGLHTRRYHGLLVAALDPPCGRHVFLSHVDATVTMASGAVVPSSRTPSRPRGASWELAKHQFPGVDPELSPFHLERFDQDPLPRWTYRVAGGELEVTLALVRGENAVVLRYAFTGPEPVTLALRPLLATRDYHHLLRENGGMLQRIELRPGGDGLGREGEPHSGRGGPAPLGEMRVQPRRELPRICFRYEGTFVGSPDWWRRFEYLAEQDRGLDYQEDLWTPGLFEITVDGVPRYLVAAVDKLPLGEPAALLEAARAAILAEDPGEHAAYVAHAAHAAPPRAAGSTLPALVRRLSVAAEVFRADLARRPGVITGYPWLEVGARDTLVALPGLYLVTGKIDGALRILREMIDGMADGLVPDHVPDAGHDGAPPDRARAPEARTADTTLWLFEAARHVADALGDQHRFVTDELLLALRDAFEAALRGTRGGVHVTADGLFAAGKPGDALTWMDARVDGKAVTSRAGCPVELTALWARGCDTLARLARAAGDLPLHERAVAERGRARRGFRARFWCDETAYPYDVLPDLAPCGRRLRGRCGRRGRRPRAPQRGPRARHRSRVLHRRAGRPGPRPRRPRSGDARGPPHPRARRARLRGPLRRRHRGARRGLPPGHGVALAARRLRARRHASRRGARGARGARGLRRRQRPGRGPSARARRRRRPAHPGRLRRPGLERRRAAPGGRVGSRRQGAELAPAAAPPSTRSHHGPGVWGVSAPIERRVRIGGLGGSRPHRASGQDRGFGGLGPHRGRRGIGVWGLGPIERRVRIGGLGVTEAPHRNQPSMQKVNTTVCTGPVAGVMVNVFCQIPGMNRSISVT